MSSEGSFEHVTGTPGKRNVMSISREQASKLLSAHGKSRNVEQSLVSLTEVPGRMLDVENGHVRWVMVGA
jgi:hypothetical protein